MGSKVLVKRALDWIDTCKGAHYEMPSDWTGRTESAQNLSRDMRSYLSEDYEYKWVVLRKGILWESNLESKAKAIDEIKLAIRRGFGDYGEFIALREDIVGYANRYEE